MIPQATPLYACVWFEDDDTLIQALVIGWEPKDPDAPWTPYWPVLAQLDRTHAGDAVEASTYPSGAVVHFSLQPMNKLEGLALRRRFANQKK